MAMKCPICRSADVQHSIGDRAQCLSCGGLLNARGESVDRGPDETTRAVMEARLRPRTDNVVGNLADLQRVGAASAPDDSVPEVQLPTGVDPARIPGPDSPPVTASEVQAAMSSTGDVSADGGRTEVLDVAKQGQADISNAAAENVTPVEPASDGAPPEGV